MTSPVLVAFAFAAAWLALFGYPCLAPRSKVLLGRVGIAVTWALACTHVMTGHSLDLFRVLVPAGALTLAVICVESWFLWKSKSRTHLPLTSALYVLIVLPLISYGGEVNNLDRWLHSIFGTGVYNLHGRAIFALLACIIISAVLWFRLSKGKLRSTQVSSIAAAAFLCCISAALWKSFSRSGGVLYCLAIIFRFCPYYIAPVLLLLVSCIATFAKSTWRLRGVACESRSASLESDQDSC